MLRRALVVVATAGMLLAGSPMVHADAHAFLTDSNPADGAVLTAAPAQLRMGFSESVVVSAVHIDIVDADGTHHMPTAIRLANAEPGGSTEDPVEVVATLPTLPPSAYRVSWQTLSSDDLHRASGVLVFGVGRPVTAAGATETSPRADEAALRWLLFVSLSVSLGGLLCVRLLRRQDIPVGVVVRCARLAAGGALLGAISAGALLADLYVRSGTSVTTLLRGSYGERWLLREIGFALLFAAAITALHMSVPRFVRLTVIAAGTACACLGSALLGHAGAGTGVAITRVAADAAHATAAATWAGALLVFVVLGLAVLPGGTVPASVVRAVLRSFGRPAAVCVGVLMITGVYLLSGVVGSVDAVLLTTYGRILLVKLAVVGVVGLLALTNHRRVRGPRARGVGRTVALESVLVVMILGLTALLTSGQPALEPQFVAVHQPATVPVVDTSVGDLQEALAIQPNRPGRNIAIVDVFDTRRPAPGPVRGVLVTVAGLDRSLSAPVSADRLADGRWSVATYLAAPGSTSVEVTVQRLGLADTTHIYRWTVGGVGAVTRPSMVSTTPIGPALRYLALALMAMLVITAAGFLLARRTRPKLSPATIAPPEQTGATPEMADAAVSV